MRSRKSVYLRLLGVAYVALLSIAPGTSASVSAADHALGAAVEASRKTHDEKQLQSLKCVGGLIVELDEARCSIVLYEVFQILLLRASKTDANLFLSEALRRRVVDLTGTIALAAASLSSIDYKLPMADAIIYETAQAHQAELITSDAHFSGLPGLR